jgi:hypothetical protein
MALIEDLLEAVRLVVKLLELAAQSAKLVAELMDWFDFGASAT